jgi:hypothetical protein
VIGKSWTVVEVVGRARRSSLSVLTGVDERSRTGM